MTRRLLTGVTMAAALAGCQMQSGAAPPGGTTTPPPHDTPGTLLPATGVHEAPWQVAGTDREWVVEVSLPGGTDGPRMAELFLSMSSPTSVTATALDAVTTAGKQVVAQPQADGRVRVLVFSSANTTRLGSGAWVRLHFADPVAVTVLHTQSGFAPATISVTPDTVAVMPAGGQP